jgi:hypothetical protein
MSFFVCFFTQDPETNFREVHTLLFQTSYKPTPSNEYIPFNTVEEFRNLSEFLIDREN